MIDFLEVKLFLDNTLLLGALISIFGKICGVPEKLADDINKLPQQIIYTFKKYSN